MFTVDVKQQYNNNNNNVSISDFCAENYPLIFLYKNIFTKSVSLYFEFLTVENNKNKNAVNFLGDKLKFYGFIQVFISTTNDNLNRQWLSWHDPNAFYEASHKSL